MSLGLTDLFALRLRHNPKQARADVFWQRVHARRWLERWPELIVELGQAQTESAR